MKRIAFYTVDLCPGREYLMPWRTILEVAKRFNDSNVIVSIINACYKKDERKNYVWENIPIYAIEPGYDKLYEFIANTSPINTLFLEIKWRDGLKNWQYIYSIRCDKIGYFSGGIYKITSALKLLCISNRKLAQPYIFESLTPKILLKNKLNKAQFKSIIGLTEYTSNTAHKNNIKNVTTIYPGKDNFEEIIPDNSILLQHKLLNKKFLLFTGAPIAFRGSSELIKAIDKVKHKDIHLVMLMRKDIGTQYNEFLQAIKKLNNINRITIIEEKLTRAQLKSFFLQAYYAILPFIVIPSEVPLTYYEILSCGTPIISFENGGTTKYLRKALLLSKLSRKSLTKTIDYAWNNKIVRDEKSKSALEIIKKHPTWDEVSEKWYKLI